MNECHLSVSDDTIKTIPGSLIALGLSGLNGTKIMLFGYLSKHFSRDPLNYPKIVVPLYPPEPAKPLHDAQMCGSFFIQMSNRIPFLKPTIGVLICSDMNKTANNERSSVCSMGIVIVRDGEIGDSVKGHDIRENPLPKIMRHCKYDPAKKG